MRLDRNGQGDVDYVHITVVQQRLNHLIHDLGHIVRSVVFRGGFAVLVLRITQVIDFEEFDHRLVSQFGYGYDCTFHAFRNPFCCHHQFRYRLPAIVVRCV